MVNELSMEQYISDIEESGLADAWDRNLNCLRKSAGEGKTVNFYEVGEWYEIGLAYQNKYAKKQTGQFYTPKDVSNVMAKWFAALDGDAVCDVCCGTGNLILTYLQLLGKENAEALLQSGKVYLYDTDRLALSICKELMRIFYGDDAANAVNFICDDFLDRNISLPKNAKVISNPPYFKIDEMRETWERTAVMERSKEFYSAVMEKIVDTAKSAVLISPYSFIGGNKFYELRKKLNDHSGFIVSFDNVPGSIFSGRKHGIFNSNQSNSVRAAITVVENQKSVRGFRCSNLIRFKNTERDRLLRTDVLEGFLGSEYQVVTDAKKRYKKCGAPLESVLMSWEQAAEGETLSDLTKENGEYRLCIPNSGRYFSVASFHDLRRSGKNYLNFDSRAACAYAYCLFNSSFSYWHWRLYDGGITQPLSIMVSMPGIFHRLSGQQKERLLHITERLSTEEEKYYIYKKNAGAYQENIKFPKAYRDEIDEFFLEAIGVDGTPQIFDSVHANSVFGE